jgi:hypothetical protein
MAIGDTTTGFEYLIGNGGPDPVSALLSTNLATLALESTASELSDGTDTDIEYYFNGVTIALASSFELNGYSVGARYYVDTEDVDTDGDPTFDRTYPGFNLVSATFTVTAQGAPADRPIFLTTTNAESLFTPSAGAVGVDAYATAGITNGSKYIYTKVFNLSEFDFIPRLSPSSQGVVRPDNGVFPNAAEINDPANGIYPVNTVTAFAPDGRRQVLLTYTYTIVYNLGAGDLTTTISIEQYANQNISDFGPTLEALLANSYYGHGIYGLDQWPSDEPALYESNATSIAPIPRPDSLIVDTSTTSGYAEYNQATYGAGFPLVLDTEPTVVPDQPEQEYTATGGVEIPGVDYTSDTYDNDIIDASEFY